MSGALQSGQRKKSERAHAKFGNSTADQLAEMWNSGYKRKLRCGSPRTSKPKSGGTGPQFAGDASADALPISPSKNRPSAGGWSALGPRNSAARDYRAFALRQSHRPGFPLVNFAHWLTSLFGYEIVLTGPSSQIAKGHARVPSLSRRGRRPFCGLRAHDMPRRR